MNDEESTKGETNNDKVQELGNGRVIVTKPRFEYRPVEKPVGGRPSMFESARTIALLESAYKINATHDEAALHAGLPSGESIKYHMKARTPLRIFEGSRDTGETVTFPELVELWKGNLTLAAKNKIYKHVYGEGTGTQDSWRVLERKQAGEWGLRAGVGSVDGSGTGLVAVDLVGEALQRAQKYDEPPNPLSTEVIPPSIEPQIHPTEGQANDDSAQKATEPMPEHPQP